jgi:hypothetical protein
MHGLKVEYRRLNRKPLAFDLATHIYERSLHGKVAVVAKNPVATLSSVRKQWIKIMRRLQIERARTLKAERVLALTRQFADMQNTEFTAEMPNDLLEADVTFATADDLVRVPPPCNSIFITYSFEREKLHMLTAWMPRNGVVVIYGQD